MNYSPFYPYDRTSMLAAAFGEDLTGQQEKLLAKIDAAEDVIRVSLDDIMDFQANRDLPAARLNQLIEAATGMLQNISAFRAQVQETSDPVMLQTIDRQFVSEVSTNVQAFRIEVEGFLSANREAYDAERDDSYIKTSLFAMAVGTTLLIGAATWLSLDRTPRIMFDDEVF